jgi:hypothetical protein
LLLAQAGAQIETLEGREAFHLDKPGLTEYFSTVSNDLFSLVFVGKLDRVRSLLDAQPSLATKVQWGETALFRLPDADQDLALEMAELLRTSTAKGFPSSR